MRRIWSDHLLYWSRLLHIASQRTYNHASTQHRSLMSFRLTILKYKHCSGTLDRSTEATWKTLAKQFLDSGVGPSGDGVVIIRAGEHGCLVKSRSIRSTWIPPFYNGALSHDLKTKIVDTTGAGNAFLGRFAIGILESRSILEGAYYGCVSASFAVEQVGCPVLQASIEGKEVWNGEEVDRRLQIFKEMLQNQKYGDRVQSESQTVDTG